MNVEEMVHQFRVYTGDLNEPYLWDDQEVLNYINEAQREAARRSRCFVDSTTDEITRIYAKAGVQSYDLDPRVIYLRRARTSAHVDPVVPLKQELMDELDPYWETRQGRVEHIVTGHDSNKVVLAAIPKVDQVIRLTVVREPLEDMTSFMDEPEISKRHHMQLMEWVYHRAYLKHDAEASNVDLAKIHLANFEREFGTKEMASCLEEEWMMVHNGLFNDGRF